MTLDEVRELLAPLDQLKCRDAITMILNSKDTIPRVLRMLATDVDVALQGHPTRHRQRVLETLRMAQTVLERYATMPPNGLVVYCGILDDDDRHLTIDFEPPRPLRTTLYLMDAGFHTRNVLDDLREDS